MAQQNRVLIFGETPEVLRFVFMKRGTKKESLPQVPRMIAVEIDGATADSLRSFPLPFIPSRSSILEKSPCTSRGEHHVRQGMSSCTEHSV